MLNILVIRHVQIPIQRLDQLTGWHIAYQTLRVTLSPLTMTYTDSSSAWEPEESAIKELAAYLRDALSAHNPAAQKHSTLVRYPAGHQRTISSES